MSDINATLGNSGSIPTIEHEGKTWRISHPVNECKAHFVTIITANAVQNCKDLKGVLSPDVYAELWNDLVKKIAGGHFRTLNAGWIEVMQGFDADVFFLLSLLRKFHPEATEADARTLYSERREEVAAVFAQVVPGFFDSLAKDWPPKIEPAARPAILDSLKNRFLPSPTL